MTELEILTKISVIAKNPNTDTIYNQRGQIEHRLGNEHVLIDLTHRIATLTTDSGKFEVKL